MLEKIKYFLISSRIINHIPVNTLTIEKILIKLVILLFEFLNSKSIKINEINNIFVNQGIGKFSGIRASLAIVKGLGFANNVRYIWL